MNPFFHAISEWTVTIVHSAYRLLVYQLYFILSNSLLLMHLFFLRLTLNNIVFFWVPLVFLIASLSAQFGLFNNPEHLSNTKNYFQYYRECLKKNWGLYFLYSLIILLILFGLKILILYQRSVMFLPFVLTSCFLLSSMLFVLLISSDSRVAQIPFKKKIEWSLLISYRLPSVTVYNLSLIHI